MSALDYLLLGLIALAALLALRIRGVEVDDIACTSKTMPRFPQDWAGLIG